jgi:hypothetical protein
VMFPYRIRIRCDLHGVGLVPVDGPPFGIPVDPADTSGDWVIDLSDMDCPVAGDDEECQRTWSIQAVPLEVHP